MKKGSQRESPRYFQLLQAEAGWNLLKKGAGVTIARRARYLALYSLVEYCMIQTTFTTGEKPKRSSQVLESRDHTGMLLGVYLYITHRVAQSMMPNYLSFYRPVGRKRK